MEFLSNHKGGQHHDDDGMGYDSQYDLLGKILIITPEQIEPSFR